MFRVERRGACRVYAIRVLIISCRVVFGYEGNSKIVVKGSGTGGLDELKGSLEDDQVHYGYLRVTSGDSESKRSKFVFISWVGEKVGPLKRAKVSVHKASVKQIVQVSFSTPPPLAPSFHHPSNARRFNLLLFHPQSYAIEVHAEKQDELQEEDILARVRKAGGADYSGNLANN